MRKKPKDKKHYFREKKEVDDVVSINKNTLKKMSRDSMITLNLKKKSLLRKIKDFIFGDLI